MTKKSDKSRKNFIGSAALIIEDYCGLSLTIEKISEIIGDKMAVEWNEYHYDSISPFMDTSTREDIMDLVAQYYLDRDWPRVYENIDYDFFVEMLKQAMKDR